MREALAVTYTGSHMALHAVCVGWVGVLVLLLVMVCLDATHRVVVQLASIHASGVITQGLVHRLVSKAALRGIPAASTKSMLTLTAAVSKCPCCCLSSWALGQTGASCCVACVRCISTLPNTLQPCC